MKIDINYVENNIDLEKFRIRNENIWPIYRNIIGFNFKVKNERSYKSEKSKELKKKLLILFHGLVNILNLFKIFKKYDFIFFTTDDDYRLIGDVYENRLTHYIIKDLKDFRILEIQKGNKLIKNKNFKNITYFSANSFLIIFKILKFFNKKIQSDNISLELVQNNIHLNSDAILNNYIIQKSFYMYLYKQTLVKKIFSTCYSNMTAIKSANTMNIDTVELQHGVINHFAYNVKKSVDFSFYPKYLCVFGENDLEHCKKYFYIKSQENIIPIGNMLIDYYSKKTNKEIVNLRSTYELLICVSLQSFVQNKTLLYIQKQAEKSKNICFILIPRNKSDLNEKEIGNKNIKFFHNVACHEIASNCDYHLTVFSTCALEAPSLGIKNIFLNINNLSNEYFEHYINKFAFNTLIDKDTNISKMIDLTNLLDKEKTIKQNSVYIKPNYQLNIKNFVNRIRIKK